MHKVFAPGTAVAGALKADHFRAQLQHGKGGKEKQRVLSAAAGDAALLAAPAPTYRLAAVVARVALVKVALDPVMDGDWLAEQIGGAE